LRYIAEVLPRYIGSFSRKSIYLIANKRNYPDFKRAKLDRLVNIVNELPLISKIKPHSDEETKEIDKNNIPNISQPVVPVKYKPEINNKNNKTEDNKPNTVARYSKKIDLHLKDNANSQQNESAVSNNGNKKYLILEKIYETEPQIEKLKNGLSAIISRKIGVAEIIIIDAMKLEYINETGVKYLERFILLCNGLKIQLQIINLSNQVFDFFIRRNIPDKFLRLKK